jgi:hypothetical protein
MSVRQAVDSSTWALGVVVAVAVRARVPGDAEQRLPAARAELRRQRRQRPVWIRPWLPEADVAPRRPGEPPLQLLLAVAAEQAAVVEPPRLRLNRRECCSSRLMPMPPACPRLRPLRLRLAVAVAARPVVVAVLAVLAVVVDSAAEASRCPLSGRPMAGEIT